jgi:hypothetical protein
MRYQLSKSTNYTCDASSHLAGGFLFLISRRNDECLECNVVMTLRICLYVSSSAAASFSLAPQRRASLRKCWISAETRIANRRPSKHTGCMETHLPISLYGVGLLYARRESVVPREILILKGKNEKRVKLESLARIHDLPHKIVK